MKTNDKEYRIYIRSTKQWVPCTKKRFDEYYRDINVYSRTQMKHGRCICPPSKRLMCGFDRQLKQQMSDIKLHLSVL